MKNLQFDKIIDKIYTGIITNTAKMYNFNYGFFSVLDGEAELHIENETLYASGGDVFFIPPESTWELTTKDSAIFFIISFDYIFTENFLGSDIKEKISCSHKVLLSHNDSLLISQLAAIAATWLEDYDSNNIFLCAQILAFFHYLKVYHIKESTQNKPEHLTEKQFQNLQKITAYIQEHYKTPMTLGSLSEQFDMTPQYMASFFKQASGLTFFEYLADIRLKKAFDYVNRSDKTSFYIAAITGFPNLGAFTKAFCSRYGCTPEQWREDHPCPQTLILTGNISEISSHSLAKDYIVNYVPIYQGISPAIKDSRSSENHMIHILSGESFEHPWTYLVNLGYTRSFMHADYRRQLTEMQSIMQFKYGRLLRPFDIVDTIIVDGQPLYDFSKIYQVLDFMQHIGLIPFIELGNKPYKININPSDRVDFIKIEESSDYYERLFNILPGFLHQCINRYGTDTVSQWQFELWTEHVYISPGFESPQVYAQNFARLYKIIKEILPLCRVGGPGYNTYAPLSHFQTIMDEIIAKGCRPDFITAYIYPYIIGGHEEIQSFQQIPPTLSSDKTIFYRRLQKISEFSRQHYPDIEDLIISEYACEVSSRNFINDSIYQATFIAKFNLEGLGLAKAFAYWLISDIPLEYKDSNRILFGGNGLINRNGIHKPGFHATHFLKDLGHFIVARDENYLLTRSDHEHFQLLFFNYAHMHEDFCKNNTSYASLKNPTAVFEPMEPKDITLLLSPLSPGTYKIRHYTINNDYANLLNEWIRLGAPENLSKSDIEYLQGSSWPHQERYFKEVRQSLEITCHVQPQEVDLYLIDKTL